jgi:hypothetical protein
LHNEIKVHTIQRTQYSTVTNSQSPLYDVEHSETQNRTKESMKKKERQQKRDATDVNFLITFNNNLPFSLFIPLQHTNNAELHLFI